MRVLLVDDDKNIRHTLTVTLKCLGHEVIAASSLEEAAKALKPGAIDFILTDYRMQGSTGIDVIRLAKNMASPPLSVVMTAYASFENAVNAIKEGAYDYIPKPFSNSQLEHLLQRVKELVDLRIENDRLKTSSHRLDYFVGKTSSAMVRLEEFVNKVAPTEASVLLVGESGTGKSELARLIHNRSARASRPFSIVNCTTLAESLIESELFGHVKGAFTGAIHDHVGKIELSSHGTLLIDEIGELSPASQAKLLRFLQERVIERVGGNRLIPVDVRVIAATNRNLEESVKAGKFREDLYFRLNVFECCLVPLRYRKEDIPILAQRFVQEVLASKIASSNLGASRSGSSEIPESVMKVLMEYSWPGNIRELRNTIERLVLLSQGREFLVSDLPDAVIRNSWKKSSDSDLTLKSLEEVERSPY